jgi:hypothetical protein
MVRDDQILTIKYDSEGNESWTAQFKGPLDINIAWGYLIGIDSLDNIYVSGQIVTESDHMDYITLKYDTNGSLLWKAQFDGPVDFCDDSPKDMVVTPDGIVYVTGESFFNYMTTGSFSTVVYDTNGTQKWSAIYDGEGDRLYFCAAIALHSSGNVFITGSFLSSTTWNDFVTVGYDSEGNQIWNARLYKHILSNEFPYDIAVDPMGNVYVAGWGMVDYYVSWDFVLVKYSPRSSIDATIDIDPDTLNLKSKGKWITCYIELPEGYDVCEIDPSTILLEDSLQPVLDRKYGWVKSEGSYIMDHDGDGIMERMVKFAREEVQAMLDPGVYNLKVTGELEDGTGFEGYSDEIRVIG